MTQAYLENYYQNHKRNYLALHETDYPLKQAASINNYPEWIASLNTPLVLSFDFHDTLTAHKERVMTEEDSMKFSQMMDRVLSTYGFPIIPVIHSVGNIFTTHNIDVKNTFYLVTEGHILLNDHTTKAKEINLLDASQQQIDDAIKAYILDLSPETRFVDHDQDELLIKLSTIPTVNKTIVSNQELSESLSTFFPKELADQASFWVNRHHDILGIHTRIGKNQISQKLLEHLGYNPSEYTYIHFGDHTPDILWQDTHFLKDFLITPFNATQKTKDYASYTDASLSPENVFSFLELLSANS